MAIELSPDQNKDLLLKIRLGEDAPKPTPIEIAQKAQEAENARMKQIDDIRMKVTSGATLSSEEEKFLKDAEAGKATPPEIAGLSPEQIQAAETAKSIDALMAKIEKGEALTDEEKALSDKIIEAPVVAEKSYKIGGKEVKASEIAPKMAEEWGVPLEEIPPSMLAKAIDTYVTKLNKAEWERAATQRDQKAAVGRRQISDAMFNLLNAQDRMKTDLGEINETLAEVRELASRQFDSASIYSADGKVDLVKQFEVTKILEARERLPKIEKKVQALTERSAQTERELTAQQFRDFQAAHPEYATSQDVAGLARLMGTDQLSVEDEVKLDEMVRIFREASVQRTTPDKEHQYKLDLGQLRVKPRATSTDQDGLKFSRNPQPDSAKLLASLKKKREGLFIGVPPQVRKDRVPDETKAAQMIRAGSQGAVMGGSSASEKIVEAGY